MNKIITFEDILLSGKELDRIRRELYHSSGPGFIIFREFVRRQIADHIVEYWVRQAKPEVSHTRIKPKNPFYPGCPAYFAGSLEGSRTYYNPFWGPIFDVATNEVSLAISQLRAKIEGKAFGREIFPYPGGKCTVPRVVITRSGKTIVPPHSDYGMDEPDPANVDLARLQATLYLSEHQKDYNGSGFVFTRNDGKQVCFARDEKLVSGEHPFLRLLYRFVGTHKLL
mgnify:CR=1 FL=1